MKVATCWIGNYRPDESHIETCPLWRDINQYGYSRRYLDSLPDCECFARHLAKQEIKPQVVAVLSYDEYRQYMQNYRDVSGLDDAAFMQTYEAKNMPGYWKHSPSAKLVFMTSWRIALSPFDITPLDAWMSAGVVTPDRHYMINCSFRSGVTPGTYTDKIFTGCRFIGPIRDSVFVRCLFINCTFERTTVERVTFDSCYLTSCSVTDSSWTDVGGMLYALQLPASNSQFSRVRFQAVETGTYDCFMCSLHRCMLPGATFTECTTGKTTPHKCVVCGQEKQYCVKVHARGWLCLQCKVAKFNGRVSYNETYKGKQDALPMFSFELETAGYDLEKCLVVLAHGFIATHDGTVDVEYKSPRYLSLASCLPALKAIDTFADSGINDACGTHLHVDCRVKSSIDAEVFRPLVRYMRQHQDSTYNFWGRYFGSYCTSDIDTGSRYQAFSLNSHYDTIEYRLPRFLNAKQYLGVIRFCRQITKLLTDTYIYTPEHLIDASKIGDKILTLYKEALAA